MSTNPQHPLSTKVGEDVQIESSARSPETGKTPFGLMWTRIGMVALVAVASWITISFCSMVYFDLDAAFHNALECSERVLKMNGEGHWLLNGTLLGSTRIGRLVLWDADLDFGVLVSSPTGFDAAASALDEQCFGYRSIVRKGSQNPELRIWRKCTSRICAEFYETALVNGVAKTGEGRSNESDLLPLKPCTVSGVDAKCPNNAPFYLSQAYGPDWLTIPFIKLF
ncbi:hypothetical protein JKF63_01918 [Porcisia hertigi]|uniref:Uncharacterized protein n=1 Tax=Porcisia hertigi TaxID=2761500 RepID=A0A836HJV5_9TRYP|nr:hypothetical protein JKF63_01918 [Porcisia hertigi]